MASHNELYHFGIPGMKWGVRRRSDTTSGSSSGTPRRKGIDKRKLARNIAIGVGTAAAIGGAAYGIHRLRKSGKIPRLNGPTQLRIADKLNTVYNDHDKAAYKEYLRQNKLHGTRTGFDGNDAFHRGYRDILAMHHDVRRAKNAERVESKIKKGVLGGATAASVAYLGKEYAKEVKRLRNKKRNTKR